MSLSACGIVGLHCGEVRLIVLSHGENLRCKWAVVALRVNHGCSCPASLCVLMVRLCWTKGSRLLVLVVDSVMGVVGLPWNLARIRMTFPILSRLAPQNMVVL